MIEDLELNRARTWAAAVAGLVFIVIVGGAFVCGCAALGIGVDQ